MNTAMTQGFQQILQQYSAIVKNYQALSEQDARAVSSPKIVTLIHNLTDATLFLSAVMQANSFVEAGDKQAQAGTQNGFSDAENSYRSAIKLYQVADDVYKKNANLVDYCPLYPAAVSADKTTHWTYVMMMQCHCAKWYTVFAEKIQDNPSLPLQYYMAAQNRASYVPESV